MSNKVYVGNLPYSFLNDDLQRLFAAFGPVRMAEVILDRTTNRSRGFGFVEMENADGVRAAISNLHETELQGHDHGDRSARAGIRRRRAALVLRSADGWRPWLRPAAFEQRPHGGARPSGGMGGRPSRRFVGGRGSGSPRGDRRPRRDEGDRWSDGGGGGRRRRRDDDFGDE